MLRIGLTGGIGSGKTNVTKTLRELGAVVLDADVIGHSIYEPNTEAFEKVVESFGKGVIGHDGKIDRRILGSKVFGDQAQMKKLTDIVWPAIGQKAKEEMSLLREQKVETVVLEAAVLIESGWKSFVDSVWVTIVPPEIAVERIMKRNNLSEEDAWKRVKSQITNEERIQHANVVIDTNGPFEQTRERIIDAWNKFKQSHGKL